MSPALFAELVSAVGRRYPRFPLALFRATPLAVIHALRRLGLRTTFRQSLRSPLYREAFERAGIDPRRARGPEDLGDFFLTSDALKTAPERLLCGTPDLAIESSGTSGRIARVYLSRAELEYNARQGGLLSSVYGLMPGDRLLCTLDLAWGLGSLIMERGIRHTRVFAMVVGRVDPLAAYERLGEYRFNVIVSDPFWLARLTEIARERGRPHPLKCLMGGGEGISDRTRRELMRFWQAPLCMTYASTEAGTVLAFECPHLTGYHVNEFDFAVEIDRPDAHGWGEIVFTTVTRRVMPLIRYRTGDVGRWEPGPCPCRLRFRRLSIRGRVDEQVSCAWGNLHPDFFEPLLAVTPGLGPDWQVGLYERDLTPVFQFRLETRGDVGADSVAAALLAALQASHPDAWLAYQQRLVDIEFCLLEPGTLRQKRKLLRLVDERGSGPPPWVPGDRIVGGGRAATPHRL